jgi:hypothetical protein
MAETSKTPSTDSLSMQRRKEEIRIRNAKILTEDKKKRLGDAKVVKVTK